MADPQPLTDNSAHAGSAYPVLYPNAHWFFALGILVTWVGFSTSYWGKLRETDIYHHIHGATAGLWMVTLVAQPLLYKHGYIELHRKLGRLAVYLLMPLLLIGGVKMMQLMAKGNYPPGVVYQLAWIDLCSLMIFPYLVVASIKNAKKLQLHARYMACTVLVLLPPAITRALFLIPWFDSFTKTLNTSYVIIYIVTVLLIIDDKRSGKIYRPYVLALLLFVIVQIGMNFAGHWPWWQQAYNAFAAY